uniref:Uncharacterized protein n=1 Tax=Arundo donax TaxID=35708 RepID=A0A0A9H072_ARUDO
MRPTLTQGPKQFLPENQHNGDLTSPTMWGDEIIEQ